MGRIPQMELGSPPSMKERRGCSMTAEEAGNMERGDGGREALEAAVRSRYLDEPLQVTVRAKMDSYNNEVRTGTTCIDARPVQRGEHGRVMLRELNEMLAGA